MRIVQFIDDDGAPAVAMVDGGNLRPLAEVTSTYELARAALARGQGLATTIERFVTSRRLDHAAIETAGRVRAPISHPDCSRLRVTGTGLTHIGSAQARDRMHERPPEGAPESDPMRMFRLGLEGGKPRRGEIGAQPEWFYKGDGDIVVPSGVSIPMPSFALAAGEEPEVAGVYVIGDDGAPWRIGFTLANDFSDHVTERQNFMYIAHSKLRVCPLGPELMVGELPEDVRGESRIVRDGRIVWRGEFASGEANMSYSIANLEHHHFKYEMFRRPGDLHVHLFGCPVLSFAEGMRAQPGDVFEIDVPAFGRPLRNTLAADPRDNRPVDVGVL